MVALVARQVAEVPQRQDHSLGVPRLALKAQRLLEALGGQRVVAVRPGDDGEVDQGPTRHDPRQPAVRHGLGGGEGLLQERGAAADGRPAWWPARRARSAHGPRGARRPCSRQPASPSVRRVSASRFAP